MSATLDTRSALPATAPEPAVTKRRSRVLRPLLMLGGVAVVAAGSLSMWKTGGRYVSIDNAYVRADKLSVATDVSGLVASIPVHEGQEVHKADVLFRLDDAPFRNAVAGAEARLEETRLSLLAMQRDYARMGRDIAGKRATVSMDQARFDRANGLVGRGDISRQLYDDARFQLLADQHAATSAEIAAEVQLAKLGGSADADVTTLPSFKQAQATLDETRRQLDHTVVRASMDGIVTGVSNLQPGVYLAAATAAFGLVSSTNAWVDANPKETELTWVRPGDKVTVSVDTYPDHGWTGTVDSIAPVSGSEFSILPAQNSSGNWVKVVQRIPLRIRLDPGPDGLPLRAGMSVEASIDTGHQRSWADLF